MRVLVAFDKFKDALTAKQACAAAAEALHRRQPDWQIELCPLTDGGDGFCETLTSAAGGRLEWRDVTGPRPGSRVRAPIGHVEAHALSRAVAARLDGKGEPSLAVVETASASGLALLPPDRRDPWQTSSRGTGELVRAAARPGVGAILLGLGGSATNDLGLGALAGLGVRFLERHGAFIDDPVPGAWERIQRIDVAAIARLPDLFLACDVANPLLGARGATATFGPQKGLRPGDLPRFEAEAARLAALLCAACGQPFSLAETPGAGAAGGLAFGLQAACGARLAPGFELVSDWLGLPARLAAADLVLTGEGRYDATSQAGKGPGALVAAARRLGKPVHVFAGGTDGSGDASVHVISPAGLPLPEALARTAELLAAAVAATF
jgi:glycerate kinase